MQYFALSVLCLVICTARCSSAASVAAVGNSIKLSRFVRRPLFGAERNPCEPGQQSVFAVHSNIHDKIHRILTLAV